MTQDQIRQVQESFRAVLPIKQQAARLFYGRLFEIDPGLRPLFAHADLAAQGNKLMAALAFVVGSLREPGPMLATVRALAVRHAGYGVQEAHYASVGKALMWTLEAGLGDAWTAELWAAWAEAYQVLSGVMIQAMRDAEAAAIRSAA